jgi:hypothetical protein
LAGGAGGGVIGVNPVALLHIPFMNFTTEPGSPPLLAQSSGTQLVKASLTALLLQKQSRASFIAAGSTLILGGGGPVPVAPPAAGGAPGALGAPPAAGPPLGTVGRWRELLVLRMEGGGEGEVGVGTYCLGTCILRPSWER